MSLHTLTVRLLYITYHRGNVVYLNNKHKVEYKYAD
ncbi:Uncharacterised protein [Vibrio cholerae]|nr:Uncharacterised protein [Vibrio cholerae]